MKRWYAALLALIFLIAQGAGCAESIGASVVIPVGGSYALIGADGDEIIAPGKYSYLSAISPDGTAADEALYCAIYAEDKAEENDASAENNQRRNGRCLLVNAKGEALTEAEYQYLAMEDGRITFIQNGLYGVMDTKLNVLIPCQYTSLASNGAGGYLALTTDPNDDEPDGVYYLEPGKDEAPTGARVTRSLNVFFDGLMSVVSADNGKCGYLDVRGEWAIRPQYTYAGDFDGDRAIASVDSGMGIIDKEGNWLLTPKYRDISANVPGGDMLFVSVGRSERNMLDPATFDVIKTYNEEEMYVNLTYDNGVAALYRPDTVQLIDKAGNVLFENGPDTNYDTFSDMGNRVVIQDGPYGTMSTWLYALSGEQVFGPAQEIWYLGSCKGKAAYAYAQFDVEKQEEASADWESAWEMEGTRTMGIIDENGETILAPGAYQMITYVADGVFLLSTQETVKLVDETGKEWISYSLLAE